MVQTNRSQWNRVTVLLATLVFGLTAANAQSQDEPASSKYREFETKINVEKSFVFLNGVYLDPPFEMKCSTTALEIDGQVFDENAFDLSSYTDEERRSRRGYGSRGMESRDRGGRGGNFFRDPTQRSPFESLSESLHSLANGMVIVLYADEAPLLLETSELGFDLLETLLGRSTITEAEISERADHEFNIELWQRLVQNFKITPEFTKRASELVNEHQLIYETNDRKTAALLLSQQIAFPLSMIAMVTVVLAFGHLMANPQQMVALGDDPLTLANAKKATIWSLTIVGVLSALDLVWTLIAHQSGAMRELNPLGNGLIHDPVQLILFKITITGLAIGILYYLHEQPLARRASWWCCLVLTLLTARWLTFNSMFL